ncbi:MAG: AMP-binding protein [Rhodospirillaceae bacterium]|nr:AMP-binding protein [Rhodospirillaceae bacterium]
MDRAPARHGAGTAMIPCLPMARWLDADRPGSDLVAWAGDHVWTQERLRRDVAALAQRLKNMPGDRWAIRLEDGYGFTAALLGLLHAGKTPVIPGHDRPALLREMIGQGAFTGLLGRDRLDVDAPQLVLDPLTPFCPAGAMNAELPALAEDRAVELFTSGSTGRPRRVVKPVACLDWEASALAGEFSTILAGSRIIASVSPQHLYGLTFRIVLPLALGLPLYADMIFYPEQLAALDCSVPHAFIASPAFLKRLGSPLARPGLSMLLSAGGALSEAEADRAEDWFGVAVHEIYGSTETGVLAWRHRVAEDPPWRPFPVVRLLADGDGWRALSPLIPEPKGVALDDVLDVTPQGCFRLLGRRDRIVKIEEKRVSLDEVERRLRALDGVCDAAAVLIERGRRRHIGALLVLTDAMRDDWRSGGGARQKQDWRRALSAWLDPVAVPRYWRETERIPENAMGKRIAERMREMFDDVA